MTPEPQPLALESVCCTCHCERRWHYQTYAGDAGCTREIGTTNPVPCACTGFMRTEAPELVEIHQREMGRRVFRGAVNRQNARDAAKYHAVSPGIETKAELDVAEAEFQSWLDGDVSIAYLSRPPFLGGWQAGRRYEVQRNRCPHGHVGCCGHHDLEDMPVHLLPCRSSQNQLADWERAAGAEGYNWIAEEGRR